MEQNTPLTENNSYLTPKERNMYYLKITTGGISERYISPNIVNLHAKIIEIFEQTDLNYQGNFITEKSLRRKFYPSKKRKEAYTFEFNNSRIRLQQLTKV
jgi:hypothetical protein